MTTQKKTKVQKETKVQKAIRLNQEMIEKIKALTCFSAPDLTSAKCLTCQGLTVCVQAQTDKAIESAVKTEKVKNASKKTAKKTSKKVSLADIFYLAIVTQKKDCFTVTDISATFEKLATLSNVRKPQTSVARSFAAHLTDVLAGKDKRYKTRFIKVLELQDSITIWHDVPNKHVHDMITANL